MSTRETAVAGQFYPARADEIQKMLHSYNQILDAYFKKDRSLSQLRPRAVIVPHAGYVYSGFTANVALRLLANSNIKTMVVIGPSHRVYLKGTSISMYDNYATPMGTLRIDTELTARLKEKFGLQFTPDAHHEHSTEVQMPLIKNYNPGVSVVELVYGDEDPRFLAKIIEFLLAQPLTAVVISTDLSHYYDIDKANKLDAICIDAVTRLDASALHQGCEACGKIGVEAMIIAAKENGLMPTLLDYRTSADASGDRSSVVGYMSVAFAQRGKTDDKTKTLTSLARAAIAEALGLSHHLDVKNILKNNPWLKEKGAAFVTLTREDDSLRGCIGSLVAHRSLVEDIVENAKSAALRDPRFNPLKPQELAKVKVEVSILTAPEPLAYETIDELRSKIRPGVDGIVLKHGRYQATFLPQVWEDLPTFDGFFAALCQKAGMGADCLKLKPDILTYQVQKYKEV